MGDCGEYLFLPGGTAFTAGWSQADYLRPLRVYLERLIDLHTGFLSFVFENCR
jgi:hypothetical protein